MIHIDSDFVEPYDKYLRFMGNGLTLRRRTTDGPDRKDMPLTIKHGYLTDLHDGPVVEYTDTRAHCGNGKILHNRNPKTPGAYGSEYVPHKHTVRELFVGRFNATIIYEKGADWRSNVDPKRVYCYSAIVTNIPIEPTILRAYDLVGGLVCDYNVSPGLPDDWPWSWQETAEEIYLWLSTLSRGELKPSTPNYTL